jgi:hypothetical protein
MSVSFANQLTPNNYPTNQRGIIDNNFVQTISLNAANTTVSNTNTIDLLQSTPYATTEIVNVQVAISACTNGLGPTNSKNVNAVIQVCSDNATWANSTIFATPLLVASSTANGLVTAVTANVKLSPNEVRYIRAQFAGEATGGTPNIALTGTIQLLF